MDPELLRRLYGGPPTGFVAARDAAVRELKAAGERDAAADVKRLRRHGPIEWALNRAAHVHPDATRAFTSAAAELREAQAAAVEGRASDVRAATPALRDRLTALARAAASLEHAPGVPELSARLLTIAADERAATQLSAGVLGAEELAPPELFAGLEPRPASGPRARAPKPTRRNPAPAPPRTTAQERARAERARRALERADEALVDARRVTDQAEARAADAREELERAERRLADAREALERAEADRREAAAAVDDPAPDASG